MKLSLFLLSLFCAFTLSGCFHAATPVSQNTNSTNGVPKEDTEDSLDPSDVKVPVISLFQEEKEYVGVEGSYCYQTMCVDKISPAQMIEDANLSYAEVSKKSFSARTDIPSTGVTVDVFTTTMELVADCDTPVTFTSDTQYDFPLCENIQGEYIIGIIGDFDNGDMTYYFPVTLK